MTDDPNHRREFFVSFNKADREWATWIAWVLEEAGYSVFFQDWDFRGSFVEEMDQAHRRTRSTVAVLSDHYLASRFARLEEWAGLSRDSVDGDDVDGDDGLILFKVGTVTDAGLLRQFGWTDLTGCDEAEAEQRLLERVQPGRASTPVTPRFPGATERRVPERPRFPVPLHNLPPSAISISSAVRSSLPGSAAR